MTISEEKIIKELQSLLEDDARILTYKYVSHKFQVHVNKAKSYLETVYNSMNDSSVSALYFICGHSIESPHTLKVMLVAGERLEKVLSQLDPVLSQHIYSLQSQPVRNTNTIYGADAQENLLNTPIDNSLCSIRHPTAHRLSDAEMKQSAPVIKQEANGLTNGNYAAADRTTSKPALNIKTEAIEKPAVKPEPSQASSHVEKSAVKTEPAQVSSRVEKTNSSTKEKKRGIASMFAQANAVQKASPSCDETKATDSKNRSNESSRKPAAKPAASDESVRFGKRGVSGGSGGKSSREPQKRRRVLALVSSSDEESEEEQHEEVPPSPPAQQETGDRDEESSDLPPSDSSARVPEKRCTRKLVDKTYVDEDGFMVTKKVYENVAESDLEQEETAKEPTDASTKQPVPDSSAAGTNDKTSPKPPNSSTPAAATSGKTTKTSPKAAAAQKPKQANIMNFFKRK